MGGVQELGGVFVFDGADEHTVGYAGDEVADVLRAEQRGHGAAVGFGSCFVDGVAGLGAGEGIGAGLVRALMQRAIVDVGAGAGFDWLAGWGGRGSDAGGNGSALGAGLAEAEDGAWVARTVDAVGAPGLVGSSGSMASAPVCCCGASSMSFRSLAKISVSSAVAGCTQVSLRWRDG